MHVDRSIVEQKDELRIREPAVADRFQLFEFYFNMSASSLVITTL